MVLTAFKFYERIMPIDSQFIRPLARFYDGAEIPMPEVAVIDGDAMPEPHKSLLVHPRDMTTTLEKFHGGRCRLKVLKRDGDDTSYNRLVVLQLEDGKPIEFGAITIFLDAFSEDAQKTIREERKPLGAILHEEKVGHYSRPQAFFQVHCDDLIQRELCVTGSKVLYGRCNQLFDEGGTLLAEIVEILPP